MTNKEIRLSRESGYNSTSLQHYSNSRNEMSVLFIIVTHLFDANSICYIDNWIELPNGVFVGIIEKDERWLTINMGQCTCYLIGIF